MVGTVQLNGFACRHDIHVLAAISAPVAASTRLPAASQQLQNSAMAHRANVPTAARYARLHTLQRDVPRHQKLLPRVSVTNT